MSTTTINIYNTELFVDATTVDQVDTFLTDGGSAYSVTHKNISRVGSTVEVSSNSYRLNEGGFTKDVTNSKIDLSVTPASGLQGIIPGATEIVFDTYDTDAVSGVTNPRICETHFWIGNPDIISTYSFQPRLGATGIPIFFADNITSIGPTTSYFQLATCNASSVTGTYSAAGSGITMLPVSASATVAASGASGVWTLLVSGTGSGTNEFQAADYVIINPGNITSEVCRIGTISGNTLNFTSGMNSSHAIAETVYVFAREFAAKETVPEGATGGQAQTFYNMSLKITADRVMR